MSVATCAAGGKIALAHLTEFPDYYSRLAKMDEEAKTGCSRLDRREAGLGNRALVQQGYATMPASGVYRLTESDPSAAAP
jgi:hypothetical protein